MTSKKSALTSRSCQRQVNGRPLVYLDNGASAQKPQVVIDAMTEAYAQEYANVHRGLHFLSNLATEKYEGVRAIIARFLNVPDPEEVVFTTGTTEGINLVSYAWAAPRTCSRATRSC
jgi:cysteine desulfurase/selenocysteine lyase